MLKKMLPLFLVLGLALGACGTNNALPRTDETPMNNIDDRERNWTPNVRDDHRGGTNLDGLDNERDGTGNGVTDGVINNDGLNNNDMFQNEQLPNDGVIDNDLNNDKNLNNR